LPDPSEAPADPAAETDRGNRSRTALRRIATGSVLGLAAGVVGLALPVALVLLATYQPATHFLSGPHLIEVTSVLAIAGVLLFALCLTAFRFGFSSLRRYDRRFWSASVLCLLGTAGLLLLVVPIAIAFTSSDAIADCIRGSPSHALACVSTVSPLASDWAVAAFWLAWLGGLGVVVGVGLAGSRFHQAWFFGGAVGYGLLLLGLLGPALGLIVRSLPVTDPLLAAPVLILAASALTFHGARRAAVAP
jgi:uncharacterized membrane protein